MNDFQQLPDAYKKWIIKACISRDMHQHHTEKTPFWNWNIKGIEVTVNPNPPKTCTTGERGSIAISFLMAGYWPNLDISQLQGWFPGPRSWLFATYISGLRDEAFYRSGLDNAFRITFLSWTSPFVGINTRHKRREQQEKATSNSAKS